MVLKDKKAAAAKRGTKTPNEPGSILSALEGSEVSNVFASLRAYLEPICKLKVSSGKENVSDACKHQIAKQFVPFLAQVLKRCSSSLHNLPISEEENCRRKADELFLCMSFALDCFEHLRQWLAGSPFEIEMQRSWLIRCLMTWRRFHEALNQDLQLLCSLCARVFVMDKVDGDRSQGLECTVERITLPHPRFARDSAPSIVLLIVGAATDFIVCSAEIGNEDSLLFQKVTALAHDLDPWLSKLEADKAEKQRSLIFRELNKCLMAAILDSREQPGFVQALSSITLHHCALSSMSDQFCKVTRTICSRLSSEKLESTKVAIKICEEAFANIFQLDQLQGLRGSLEMLELVEYYSRLYQSSKSSFDGWRCIYKHSESMQGSPIMALAGFYAVGLALASICPDSTSQIVEPDNQLELKACSLLDVAVRGVQMILTRFGEEFKFDLLEVVDCTMETHSAASKDRKVLVGVYRAIDFVRRSTTSYAQLHWEVFIARGGEAQTLTSELHDSLISCLLLFCKLVKAGLECGSLASDESDLFQKGGKSFFLAAIAAFRLSMLRQDGEKEAAVVINNSMMDSFAGPEELRWLMSSSYNMGVQLFNLKLHKMACEPFRISYAAAWARVSRMGSTGSLDTVGCIKEEATALTEFVADACAKSNILLDTLFRTGSHEEAVCLFRECVERWARTGLAGLKNHSSGSLVQLWFKKVFAMKVASGEAAGQNVMCSFLFDLTPALPLDIVGLLLKEELSFYDSLEESECLLTRRYMLDLLLNRVYISDRFSLQRSITLVEKVRLGRLHTPQEYSGYLRDLEEAIEILVKTLDAPCGCEGRMSGVKSQLAVNYFIRALCLQEIDPSNKNFLEDIEKGLDLGKGLFSCKVLSNEDNHGNFPAHSNALLQNVADLLNLRGHSFLQSKVYGLLLDMAAASQANPEDAVEDLFMDRKLSHLFCYGPFVHAWKDLVRDKLGLDLESQETLKGLVSRGSKGLLSGFLIEILRELSGKRSDNSLDDLALSDWAEIARASHDCKTIEGMSRLSLALFILAETAEKNGTLGEALQKSREALRLRLKLLNRSFKILNKSPFQRADKAESLEASQKAIYLETLGSVAVNSWPKLNLVSQAEPGPSQWQILGDYLESLMQVGVLSELLGFVDDAESSFLEGCQLANSQCLPFAQGLFLSCLGEIERKRHLWDQAHCSFQTAAQLFDQHEMGLACQKCMQLAGAYLECCVANLERRRMDRTCVETSKLALATYESAERKVLSVVFELCNGGQVGSESHCEQHGQRDNACEAKLKDVLLIEDDPLEKKRPLRSRLRGSVRTGKPCTGTLITDGEVLVHQRVELAKHLRRGPDPSTALMAEPMVSKNGYRTRQTLAKSKYGKGKGISANDAVNSLCAETESKLNIQEIKLSKAIQSESVAEDMERDGRICMQGMCCDANLAYQPRPEATTAPTKDQSNSKPCLFHSKGRIWRALSVHEWLDNKWISKARQLMARIRLQKAKCLVELGNGNEAQTQFYRALAVLREGDLIASNSFDSSGLCGLDCLLLREPGPYPIEEGCLFYHISMFVVRKGVCELSRGGTSISFDVEVYAASKWLCHAFLLCKEMPPLLCKISRILAILHVPRALGGAFDFAYIDGFHPSRTAPYFHQVSLGAVTRQQHLSTLDARKATHLLERTKIPELSDVGLSIEKMQQELRVLPNTLCDLQSVVQEDIELPCSTICISLVDEEMHFLYGGLKEGRSEAWLLVSRFDTAMNYLSVLLPCAPLPESVGASCCPYSLDDDEDKPLSSVHGKAFDGPAAKLRTILDESHQSTSCVQSMNSVEDKSRWWEWRMDLDARLGSLLRALEDSWLGPWKSVLLGNCAFKGTDAFKRSAEGLTRQLESMTKKGPLNVDLVYLLLQGAGSLTRGELEKGIAWLLKEKWVLGHPHARTPDERDFLNKAVEAFVMSFQAVVQSGACACMTSCDEGNGSLLGTVQKNLLDTFENMEKLELCRAPITLVLDSHIQALPWESLPALRKQEVYRIPYVGIMKVLNIQRLSFQAIKGQLAAKDMLIPAAIDPCNTYFLLNPSGDLVSTQAAFENMFKCQKGWEGKVGQVPTINEHINGLQTHELFVYFGHGSGDQYLPERRMRKMNCCAAALLMGCSSGRLAPRGDYEPVGVPLWYLMAGCPSAIANLWDVTDGDIDRFSRSLLRYWLEPRPSPAMVDPSSRVTIQRQCAKGKKKEQKLPKSLVPSPTSTSAKAFSMESRMASHVGESRNACRLTNLIGASPVCYGIPTLVRQNKLSC